MHNDVSCAMLWAAVGRYSKQHETLLPNDGTLMARKANFIESPAS